MEKEAYLKHREAARPIKDAYLNLLEAIRNAPDDTCIRVGIERKGGEWKDISVEYLAVPLLCEGPATTTKESGERTPKY
jgi:hypothetical protein